jgi:hypothetical protein
MRASSVRKVEKGVRREVWKFQGVREEERGLFFWGELVDRSA